MATKIAIVGAPSCRKTTVSEQLKINLKLAGYNAEIAPEFARTYIRNFGPPEHVAEQLIITQGQIELERSLMEKHDIVICDSASFLGYIYASMIAGRSAKDNMIKNEIHRIILEHMDTYDYVYFFPKEGQLINDGIRYQTDKEAEMISKQIEGMLLTEKIPSVIIRGDVPTKVNAIINDLASNLVIDKSRLEKVV